MEFRPERRRWLTAAAALALTLPALPLNAASPRPFRIYAITFRGMTEVEKGFEEYFASRKIPVQIIYRDLNRDPTRMTGFLEEIQATRPDLIYT
jgi:putative ABC transport system substrate-binding protein